MLWNIEKQQQNTISLSVHFYFQRTNQLQFDLTPTFKSKPINVYSINAYLLHHCLPHFFLSVSISTVFGTYRKMSSVL